MKAALLCLMFCGVLGISFARGQSCTKQSDCDEDECCLDSLFFKRPYCSDRYRAGQGCVAGDLYKAETDLYYLACPCVKMYECLGPGTNENGVTVMKDPKCIMPTK